MTLKSVPNIKGPEAQSTQQGGTDIAVPACVQLKTEQDAQEFRAFVESVIRAANENALNNIAKFVSESNAAMTALVKKLGAT